MYVNIIHRVLDLLAPRTCCICGRRLAVGDNLVCTSCLLHLPFTDFIDNVYENDMAKAFWGRIKHFEKAFAPFYHLPHSQSARIIYQLKYFNKPGIGIDIGEMIGKKLSEKHFFEDIDCLLPVPLSHDREKKRGYNQSEMIAEGLRNVTKLPILKGAVRRISFGESQTKKSRMDRNENVRHVFKLVRGEKVKGRHILVVDDVVTSGATICALAAQLEQMEGVRISVVAIGYAGEWRFMEK